MLTKKDLQQIEVLLEKKMTRAFADFFDKILAPYLDQEHKEIMQKFKENDEDHENIFRKLDRNQTEHDEMFEKLDEIEHHGNDHGKRIKRLESISAS